MSVEVVMPQMGESLSEGTVSRWLKKVGDQVTRDEPLFEITTDKVDTEVPAPASGTLEEILIQEGETVVVGTVVAMIASGESESLAGETSKQAPAPSPPPSSTASVDQGGGGHFKSTHQTMTFKRAAPSRTPSAESPPSGATRRNVLSPAVLSLAAQHQLPMSELTQIRGTGTGGRITKRDVQLHLENRVQAPPARPEARASEVPPEYLYQPTLEDDVLPMSIVRKKIAEHMIWSQRLSAQVTSFTECDMHRIVRYRDEHRASFEAAQGFPLTFMPFVAEATVRALKAFPIFNASVLEDQIVMKKHVHLGIAVMLDKGLIVPVVKNADQMSFVGLGRALHDLASRARSKQLAVADVQGATFTLTNPGMFGGLTGTPMINQPQVAILGMGAIQKKPVVIDDAIAIRPIMVLALTFDHRVIDGATGFQFIEHVRKSLESFELNR